MSNSKSPILQDEILVSKIYFIRGTKVMLDRDLAELYGVLTKNLNKAVKRNIERFPEDFMFQINKLESENLKFQIGTSRWGGSRTLPFAFTELGVAMLSSVLSGKQAVAINIKIMRVFTQLREIVYSNKEILSKLDQLEKKVESNSEDIDQLFSVIRELANPEVPPRDPVGYKWKQGDSLE